MHSYKTKANSGLSAIRDYVRLLVAAVLVLSLSLIGYIYWHDSQRYRLEKLANHYHLETILSCSQIKEEVLHIRAPPGGQSISYTAL